MKATRVPVLVAVFVVAGAVAYLVERLAYASLPVSQVAGPLGLLLLALAEGWLARATVLRRRGEPGMSPLDPMAVTRYVALARASSPVAALVAGGYAGVLGYAVSVDFSAAGRDTRVAAIGVLCGLALVVAALYLERSARLGDDGPDDGPDDDAADAWWSGRH